MPKWLLVVFSLTLAFSAGLVGLLYFNTRPETITIQNQDPKTNYVFSDVKAQENLRGELEKIGFWESGTVAGPEDEMAVKAKELVIVFTPDWQEENQWINSGNRRASASFSAQDKTATLLINIADPESVDETGISGIILQTLFRVSISPRQTLRYDSLEYKDKTTEFINNFLKTYGVLIKKI